MNPGPGNADLGTKVFFIWGSTCFGCLIFTFFFIPEASFFFHLQFESDANICLQTKGLSLEQIDLMYEHVIPLKSYKFRAQLQAGEIALPTKHDAGIEHTEDEKEKV